jgi:hypothetical protein
MPLGDDDVTIVHLLSPTKSPRRAAFVNRNTTPRIV